MKGVSQRKAYEKGIEFQFVDPIQLGPIVSYSLKNDPIHMAFALARYKFVARLLSGKRQVLEIGCGDAFGTPIVAQFVGNLTAIDIDDRLIASNKKRLAYLKNVTFETMEFGMQNPHTTYDAIYAIDVIEHLDPHKTKSFFERICSCLTRSGVCIIGTPNINASQYSSPQSSIQHINTHYQSHSTLKATLSKYFQNVFMFGMNDEVVHTGFLPMAHYLWALAVGKK